MTVLHVFYIRRTLMEDERERERKDSLSSVSPVETPRKRRYSSSSNTSTSRVKVIPYNRNLPSSIGSLYQERESISAFLLKTGWARWTNNH